MARLDVDAGKSIYYEQYEGTGPAVVLVHGWGMASRVWDLTVPALLEAGHEVVAYDHRCCGRSDKDFRSATTDDHAADLVALVNATGVQRPVIAGWSYGAAVVAQAAGALGDRVAGLVLVGPPTPRYTQAEGFPHGGTAEIMEQTLTALRDTRPDFLHGLSQSVCHGETSAPVVNWMWAMFLETGPRADASLGDLGTIDHRELLPTLTAPALVMRGAHDAIVDPAIADVCASLLPSSRLVEFADSGHAPFLEERERFNAELLAFVADPAGAVERGPVSASS